MIYNDIQSVLKIKSSVQGVSLSEKLRSSPSGIKFLILLEEILPVAGFPVLFMYFPAVQFRVKSRDFFECACKGERRQTQLCMRFTRSNDEVNGQRRGRFMKLCTNKQERLIRVLVELKSVNQSESCLLKPRELEISPYTAPALDDDPTSHKKKSSSATLLSPASRRFAPNPPMEACKKTSFHNLPPPYSGSPSPINKQNNGKIRKGPFNFRHLNTTHSQFAHCMYRML